MHTDRFVIFKFQDEWLVTYSDRTQTTFETLQDAERSAFEAADCLASSGCSVSVLILPDGSEDLTQPQAGGERHPRSVRLN